jgi:plasmid stabilization system protein ParE
MSQPTEYKLFISDKAKRMMKSHIRFIAEVNKDAAKAKKNEFAKALASLSQYPQRFPFLDGDYITPNKYRKMFVEKYYLVLYQIKENCVYVDYVVDCRQDYSWLLI